MTHSALAHSAWPPAPETRPPAQATPLILVIDDSITVRKIIEITLRRAGFGVVSFADGVTALRWLASPEAMTPALIYLDIELPRMNGYEVARMLRCRPRLFSTPLVMLSGRDGVLDHLKSRLVDACVHLTKPFKAEQVVELTRSLLASKDVVSQ
jgi:twitching motility two-component system response regulator PilG